MHAHPCARSPASLPVWDSPFRIFARSGPTSIRPIAKISQAAQLIHAETKGVIFATQTITKNMFLGSQKSSQCYCSMQRLPLCDGAWVQPARASLPPYSQADPGTAPPGGQPPRRRPTAAGRAPGEMAARRATAARAAAGPRSTRRRPGPATVQTASLLDPQQRHESTAPAL